ncbi:MAG: nickel pincer cofactor biosynthesis protein LarB [Myxococcales bacterium]|nr:nickel pincer cofactor biosynthesis protein LarB [Myxococcales bacterium]
MDRARLEQLLEAVARGDALVSDAADALEGQAHLPHSTVDLARIARLGHAEVVYGEGKTAAEIADILRRLASAEGFAFATRVDAQKAEAVRAAWGEGSTYHPVARVLHVGEPPAGVGLVVVVSAGTSDHAVAMEAATVARLLGNRVVAVHDVGVAGVHRLFARLDELIEANVVIVVAGMDGALPSVVGGLVAPPVIAVPTSVGYGSAFGGLAALLAMLNSCAPGVTVVNIDNGFGAAFAASRINQARCRGAAP